MRVRHLLAAVSLSALGGTTALADPPGLFGVVAPQAISAPQPPPAATRPAWPRRARPHAAVASGVVVRGGNHPGYGRLTFDFPGSVDVATEQNGDSVTLHFDAPDPVGLGSVMVPRNVSGLSGDAHTVIVGVSPGAQTRSSRNGNQIVLDILDPAASAKGQRTLPPIAATAVTSTLRTPITPAPVVANALPRVSEPRDGGAAAAATPAAPPSTGPEDEPSRSVAAEPLPASDARQDAPGAPLISAPVITAAAPIAAPDAAGSDLGASEPPAPAPSPAHPAPALPDAARPARATPSAAVPAARPDLPASPIPAAAVTTPAAAAIPAVPQASTVPPAVAAPAVVAPDPRPIEPAADQTTAAPGWSAPTAPGNEPVHLSASHIPVTPGSQGAAISLPFAGTTGAAAVRRGETAIIVFDEKRPIDLASLHDDPVFGSLGVQLQEGATILRLHLPAGTDMRLGQVASGWTLWVGPVGDRMDVPLQPLASSVAAQRMLFTATLASKVLVVLDPDTGRNFLVGTQRRAGQAVLVERRTPDFILLPSIQGLAIEPTSDRPELRVGAPGFVLSGGSSGLSLSDTVAGDAPAAAATLSRRFDLPAMSVPMLLVRLQNRIDDAAATARLARLQPRRAVAEAMVALGLGNEAEAMLRLAVTDDPRGAEDPDMLALGAVAAVLSHRPLAAAAIDDPRQSGTAEIQLWRALRTAEIREDAPEAAADLAATAPLVLSYPEPLRDKLLPLVAETEVLGGQLDAASRLLEKRPDDPRLALARALLARAKGDTPAALAGFDEVTQGRDRLQRYRAALDAIDLRQSSGAMTAGDAADAAEKLMFAWRGDERERALRVRVAAWREKAGQWRAALALLRESAALYPDERPQWRQRMKQALDAVLHDDRSDKMDSYDLVSLLGENADLLPDGTDGEAASTRLADRLQMLDLDQRAAPVLERLARTAPSPAARASFGERLAALRLTTGDAPGALAALASSASDGLSPGLLERRTILGARADAAAGRLPQAATALSALATPGANAVRADLLEAAKDWPGAAAALSSLVAGTVPVDGPLTPEQSRLVLRLAAALAQAKDEGGLARLRAQDAARMTNATDGPAFRLLTEAPVRNVSDLPRAATEMTAARAVARTVR